MHNHSVKLEQMIPLILDRLEAGESVQFTTRGTSMRPMLFGDRDQIILSPLPEKLKKYDLPLYQRDDGQFVLHRIVKTGETFTCIGDNQYEYEQGIRPEQIIAVATGFVRNGKMYSTAALSHRIYCRFWHITRPVRYWLFVAHTALTKRFGTRHQQV